MLFIPGIGLYIKQKDGFTLLMMDAMPNIGVK